MGKKDKPFIEVWNGEVPPAPAPAESVVTPVGQEAAPPAIPLSAVDPNLIGLAAVLMIRRLRELREEEEKQ